MGTQKAQKNHDDISKTMKTIKQLQIEQYGREIKSWSYGQNVNEDMSEKDFWLYFNIDYKQCKTLELLSLLNTLRVYQSRYFSLHLITNERLYKIEKAIKGELATREHIPNKVERKIIRKKIIKH